MFICVYMYPYLPISICIFLYLHPYLFKSEKKGNQNQNCSHGKYEVEINGQNIFILQFMSNWDEMHLQIIGWQFLFKFLLQGQLFLLTSFWMLGFIYAAQHSMMNAKVKCLGEINCQTEFRHYSFYDVKKVRTVTPRHL